MERGMPTRFYTGGRWVALYESRYVYRVLYRRLAGSNSGRKTDLQTSDSRGNRPNWAMGFTRKLDHVLRQVSIGSKPNKTHQNERSIQGKHFVAILGIFEFMVEITNQGRIRGNQKLLIPYDVNQVLRLARSSRILTQKVGNWGNTAHRKLGFHIIQS